METVVAVIWVAVGVYVSIGVIAAVYLHARVLPHLDDLADGASIGFRIVVTPGLVALWPVLLRKASMLSRGAEVHGSPDHLVTPGRIRASQSVLMILLAIATPILVAAALLTRPGDRQAENLPAFADTEVGTVDGGTSRAED